MTMGQGTVPEVNPCPISIRFTGFLPEGQGALLRQPSSVRVALSPLSALSLLS